MTCVEHRWRFAHKTMEEKPRLSRNLPTPSCASSLPPSTTASGTRSSPRSYPNATLTDDGNPRSLRDWIDREIFSAHRHLNAEREEEDRLQLPARLPHRHLRGEMSTPGRFPATARQ